MTFAALADNVDRVQQQIAAVQAREGIEHEVTIVAVTKGHGLGAVAAAVAAGIGDVGENRVQEAVRKQDAVGSLPVRWHLIGHLQSNKAKLVPGRFEVVHSIDSCRVAEVLDRAVTTRGGGPLSVLVQVNVAGESQKFGCRPDEVDEVVARAAGLPALRLLGLMTMAPFTADEREQRRLFGGLRVLRDELECEGYVLPELSMGMSNDYRAAVAEGATMLRLGTVLFGQRAA